MKRIIENKKIFGLTQDTDLASLKIIYRNLIKEWHPDKFQDENLKEEAEQKSKKIIEAYHFLVSISPETHALNADEYTETINLGVEDFLYKGQTLKITFINGRIYEYLGVPQSTYNKMLNSPTVSRFARRHIFSSFTYRNISKNAAVTL